MVMDDDINIRDPFQVDWAIAFRMQPATDIRIIPDTDPITLDPSQPLKDGKLVPSSEQVKIRRWASTPPANIPTPRPPCRPKNTSIKSLRCEEVWN